MKKSIYRFPIKILHFQNLAPKRDVYFDKTQYFFYLCIEHHNNTE